ncbi:MAG TPA: class I SAM-dependent methyltransferase [Polyangiaceae bacterium]|nr:class I SAM-dependent methyltransferase [Polyangiaceae bacterium]
MSSSIAVMELLLATGDSKAAARCIEERAVSERTNRYDELLQLLGDHRQGCDRAISIARRFDQAPAPVGTVERVAFTKNRFDEAVGECEEASVALYSLGDANMLRAATDEVVRAMIGWEMLGRDKDVLQIGCGIGRFEAALSPHVRSAVGIDVSPKMIDAARRRTAKLANVRCEVCSGLDLAGFEEDAFDLVYAVDSMPYIVEAGLELVATHFREAARVLRRDGEFVICGFSYRGDLQRDRAEVGRLSSEYGFAVLFDGISPYELWNGHVFRLRRQRDGVNG